MVAEIKLHLTPVKTVADCMVLAVEASQIHTHIMTMIRLENMFSEEAYDTDNEGKNDLFIEACKNVYEDKQKLQIYIHNTIDTIMETEDINYSFKLPKMFIMTAFTKEKNEGGKGALDGLYEPEQRDIVILNEDGNYVFTRDFEGYIKTRSVMNPDFLPNLLKEIWVLRMSEQSSFGIIKKKAQQFLKDRDIVAKLRENLSNYIKKEKEKDTQRTNAVQLMQSELLKLRKE